MYSIGELAEKAGLSRSTLLYYDSIGLLKAKTRTASRYRLYSEENLAQLKQIVAYRQMGLPLKEIKEILNQSHNKINAILQKQLIQLSEKIGLLRKQQFTIIKLLEGNMLSKKAGIIDKDSWVSLLRSVGLDKKAMKTWHQEFEKTSPQAHYDFLVYLGLNEETIKKIRKGLFK